MKIQTGSKKIHASGSKLNRVSKAGAATGTGSSARIMGLSESGPVVASHQYATTAARGTTNTNSSVDELNVAK